MCYNVAALTYAKLKYAIRIGASQDDIDRLQREYERLKEESNPLYYANSFGFPKVPIHRNTNPLSPVIAEFSLIPRFSKTKADADNNRRKYRTANVTIEKIRTSRMYKDVLDERKCLVVLDGFYEYYHFKSKAHPHFVYQKDVPLLMCGLWDEWVDKETGEIYTTCNIITQPARGFMKELHNNPKRDEPRMPVILRPELKLELLNDFDQIFDALEEVIISMDELEFHPVGKLTGKDSIGNAPEAQEEDQEQVDKLSVSELADYHT